jgi:EamA domain-containing membrane protein RarD
VTGSRARRRRARSVLGAESWTWWSTTTRGDEGPTAASMTNYLTPVVAVLLGFAFVDERLTWNLGIGTAMILIGLWIADQSPKVGKVASGTVRLSGDKAGGRERI